MSFKDLTESQKQVAKEYGYSSLFAEKEDLSTAYHDAMRMIHAIPTEEGSRIFALTAAAGHHHEFNGY